MKCQYDIFDIRQQASEEHWARNCHAKNNDVGILIWQQRTALKIRNQY